MSQYKAISTWQRRVRHAVGCAGLLFSAGVMADEGSRIDPAAWYGTLAGGVMVGSSSSSTQVSEGVLGVPVQLSGRTRWGHGNNFSVAVGRQIRLENSERSSEALLLRLEAELWVGQLDRKSFNVAALNANLNDKLKSEALFLNGLVRVASTENYRWWLGGGIGYANSRLPDASGGALKCACLGSASGSGPAYRLKVQGERLLSDQSALFVELGHVRLASLNSTASGFPRTHYDRPAVTHVSIGWRKTF